MTPRIHIYQKFTVYINRYRVFNDNSGVPGTLYCFAEQKRAKLKERIYFYDTEEKINILFTFRADKVMDVHGKFYVKTYMRYYINFNILIICVLYLC